MYFKMIKNLFNYIAIYAREQLFNYFSIWKAKFQNCSIKINVYDLESK